MSSVTGMLVYEVCVLETHLILHKYLLQEVNKENCNKSQEGCELLLYQKSITDPDQMAARLSGLEVNSSYKLLIRALTAVGAGKATELKVQTAKQRPGQLKFAVCMHRYSCLLLYLIFGFKQERGSPDCT